MVAFFIPHAPPDEVEQAYAGICKSNGVPVTNKRIRALSWHHHSQAMSCEVGKPAPAYYQTGDELVAAILKRHNLYMVCTPSRGVLSDGPILVGEHEVHNVSYFDP